MWTLAFGAIGRFFGSISWKVYACIAVVVLGCVLLYSYKQSIKDYAYAQCQLAVAQNVDQTDKDTIAKLQADLARRDADIQELTAKNTQLGFDLGDLRTQISKGVGVDQNGTTMHLDDAPAAPVLRYTIDKLRQLNTPAPTKGGANATH